MNGVVGFVVPHVGGDRSWVDGALAAAQTLRSEGLEVEVVPGTPAALPGHWAVAVAHGIQYEALVRARPDRAQRVVLSDRPATPTDANVTSVDWSWHLGGRAAGAAAGLIAREQGRTGPVGLVAGPTVDTQLRFADAFARGLRAADPRRALEVRFVTAFDDVAQGAAAGVSMTDGAGCALVAHSADSAGMAATAAAADRGVPTIGFLSGIDAHVAAVTSDITGVLVRLVREAVAGRPTPSLYVCSLESGDVGLALADGVGEDIAARVRELAATG
ncbi:BMP family ABC transporter substrate-binding protein [Streptomyces sp. NPDC047000]|uniref:BMP family ABC transporter substrate-binding protein n=1 Tax=Streptomyces sp. NPDC047000 TaxID=3155474 RepID=UPI0033C9CEAC